jgi:PmbA protein
MARAKTTASKAPHAKKRVASPPASLRGRGANEVRDLATLCARVVEAARRAGATEADAFAERSRRATVRVRDGEIEDLTQATSKGVGLRVVVDGRLGFASTSDFSQGALDRFVRGAVALARSAARDPCNRLPDAAQLGGRNGVMALYDDAVASLAPEWKIEASREMERAARAEDPRIVAFDSVGAGEYVAEAAIASTAGLVDGYRGTYVYLYAVPVARGDDGQLQTSYWVDYQRKLADLETPEHVGRVAARRAVRMVGARKPKTTRVPVVLEPMMAASFIAGLAGALSGDLVVKKATFLDGKLGQRIAPQNVSVVDDPLLSGGVASTPFDGDGLATRRLDLVTGGVLQRFLYDAYTARKAKTRSTASAQRGYSGLPSIGTTNLYLAKGGADAGSIVRGVKEGLYVTAMLGRGLNTVTGEYSRGANGLWIRDGELAEPVQEVTVAGHMIDMLRSIDAVGDDLDFRGAVGAPTIRFSELTVSGA